MGRTRLLLALIRGSREAAVFSIRNQTYAAARPRQIHRIV
jgi:hypothetical protein